MLNDKNEMSVAGSELSRVNKTFKTKQNKNALKYIAITKDNK